MRLYHERQFGFLIAIIIVPITIFMVCGYIYNIGTNPISLSGLLVMLTLFVFVVLLLIDMKTDVYSDRIVVRYGIGVIRRTFPINEIDDDSLKRMSFGSYSKCTQYGINFTPAVGFVLKHSRKHFAIGSKHPQMLLDAINQAISRR